MANTMRDVARERRWRDALQRFVRSRLGVRAFCRREKLAESAFYFWRREIARRDGELPKPSSVARRTVRPPSFLPLHVTDAAAHDASITLELAGDRVLRLPERIPAQRLAEIIVALETRTAR